MIESLRLIQREGGGEIVERLVAAFLEETPSLLAALYAAAERGDAPAFWHTAHALNGTCRSVGATRMGAICLVLERLGDSGYLAGAPAHRRRRTDPAPGRAATADDRFGPARR